MLQKNLEMIYENIEQSAIKSGRRMEDITLIAVTKTVEPSVIRDVLSAGVFKLGENKVQELLTKHSLFSQQAEVPVPEWHMIGHLQTNKVKSVIDKVQMIQSVDSVRLADEINLRAQQKNIVMDVLIEINIAKEDKKYGFDVEETEKIVEYMFDLSNIRLCGLMCIAPFVVNPIKNKKYFNKMYEKFIDIKKKYPYNSDIRYLSMGMSNDYIPAIEEGANMVRIGSSLFGARS